MKCIKCKFENNINAKFCIKCGTPLQSEEKTSFAEKVKNNKIKLKAIEFLEKINIDQKKLKIIGLVVVLFLFVWLIVTYFISNGDMVFVKGGTFSMGGNKYSDEKPIHTVTVDDFYIGKYEVTFTEYDKFCEDTGRDKPSDEGWGRGNRPVINVSWNDAQAYCKWAGGRLPTEAEWEYAARGGNKSKGYTYSGSNTLNSVAWYRKNSYKKGKGDPDYGTHKVGAKQPNELGIFDMSGNVWEWCSDWYDKHYYSSSPNNNPKGPSSGTSRVLRGGSWDYFNGSCRSTNRLINNPGYANYSSGFRFVQDL